MLPSTLLVARKYRDTITPVYAKLNAANQYFFKNKVQPENGVFTIPKGPGFGIELDQTKIVKIESI